jgi:hypothetical protein
MSEISEEKDLVMSEVGTKDATAARLSDDLIWGVGGIADFLGKNQRQTFHLIYAGAIPTAKIGGRIVASRSRLRAHFRALLDGEVA